MARSKPPRRQSVWPNSSSTSNSKKGPLLRRSLAAPPGVMCVPVLTTGKEALWVLAALFLYRMRILPVVNAEVERWRGAAAEIPDPSLKCFAEEALSEKVANVEATAVFALLAPRRSRVAAIRAIVSLQV